MCAKVERAGRFPRRAGSHGRPEARVIVQTRKCWQILFCEGASAQRVRNLSRAIQASIETGGFIRSGEQKSSFRQVLCVRANFN